MGLGSWPFNNFFRFRFLVRNATFYSFLTFFPRTLCTITWVCLGAALGEYEEHKQTNSQQYDQQYRHQPTNPSTLTTLTTPETPPPPTTPTPQPPTLTTSQTRFQRLLPDSASYFGQKNGRVAFTRIHFMFFFPCPFPFIFSSVPFLHTYLSCSPCQVYFWRLMYIDFFLSFNFI